MAEVVMNTAGKHASCSPAGRVTRSLLGYGLVAGPFYVVVALVQAAIRPGFELTRHDVSLLSNGDLGWIQIANFILTGAFVIACAVGVRRATGSTWAPILLGLYGLGLVAAGVFVADPMNGFPAGAPKGMPSHISVHGMLHIVSAAVGFLGLVGACFVLGSRFARSGLRRWAWASRIVGIAFLLGFGAIASGSSSPAVVLAFWTALLAAWAWLAAVSLHLYRRTV